MPDLFTLAIQNLTSPMILSFLLGALAAAVRSDLSIPESIAKALSLYLMFAIGFKGGVSLAQSGVDASALSLVGVGLGMSFGLPVVAFALLRAFARVGVIDAAAIAGHYGSISIVTFVTAVGFLNLNAIAYDGVLVAVMALMETPAIVTALVLAARATPAGSKRPDLGPVLREVAANGSVLLLIGSFLIGWATGERGDALVAPLTRDLFNGLLCFFLLDMGLMAMRQRGGLKRAGFGLFGFGLYMPLIGGAVGLGCAWALGLDKGSGMLLTVLGASASYIAVPAAMRLALPKADPALSIALSLAVTFPFNVLIGIPLYYEAARRVL
jgi:hypothetical protein